MNPKTIAIINMVLCVKSFVANSGNGGREKNSLWYVHNLANYQAHPVL